MTRYKVSAAAKADFLSDATAVTADSANVSPRIFCTHRCLAMRSARSDPSGCNGFIYEGGQCKLNYRAPDWVLQELEQEQEQEEIYFDLWFPK